MKTLLATWLITFSLTPSALADGPFEARTELTPAYYNGTGSNWVNIKVDTTPDADRLRLFWVEFDRATKAVRRMNLPRTHITRECDFRRSSGGSIGDYKPKRIEEGLRLGKGYMQGNARFVYFDDGGADYNDNPLRREYNFDSMTSLVSEDARGTLSRFCESNVRELHFFVTSQGWCRWKPENWFKPGNFPWETMMDARPVYFHARLICVN